MLERALKALKDSPIEIAEDIHYEGGYVNSRYTRFYIERDVEDLDDALDDEKLKSWAVDTMAALHQHLTLVLDEEL